MFICSKVSKGWFDLVPIGWRERKKGSMFRNSGKIRKILNFLCLKKKKDLRETQGCLM